MAKGMIAGWAGGMSAFCFIGLGTLFVVMYAQPNLIWSNLIVAPKVFCALLTGCIVSGLTSVILFSRTHNWYLFMMAYFILVSIFITWMNRASPDFMGKIGYSFWSLPTNGHTIFVIGIFGLFIGGYSFMQLISSRKGPGIQFVAVLLLFVGSYWVLCPNLEVAIPMQAVTVALGLGLIAWPWNKQKTSSEIEACQMESTPHIPVFKNDNHQYKSLRTKWEAGLPEGILTGRILDAGGCSSRVSLREKRRLCEDNVSAKQIGTAIVLCIIWFTAFTILRRRWLRHETKVAQQSISV